MIFILQVTYPELNSLLELGICNTPGYWRPSWSWERGKASWNNPGGLSCGTESSNCKITEVQKNLSVLDPLLNHVLNHLQ